MAKDVVIVPANGSISFSNNSVLEATIYNNNGDLYLSPNSGNVILGDGSPGNIEVGNTTTSVDFTFLGGGTITGGGNALDIGAAGDTINMNLSGVTYNFPNTVVTTSVYTASDILTKIKTVDGSGSGLDADLLDGGDWTTPGTIGSSIANTGSFTTLTAVNLSVTGNTTLGDAAADNITINANTITIAANSNIDAGTLFIDSLNNRVGIGTTAPARELHIVANTAGVDGIRLDNPNSGSGVGVETAIELYNAGNFMSKFSSYRDTNELRILNPQSGITSFYTANNERMRIAANGNIGIRTTTPNTALAVNGETSVGFGNKLTFIGLDINSGLTPNFIKIRTNIPVASGAADFTVNIKGFRYGGVQMCDLKIGWHYYLSTFYNVSVASSAGWAPTVRLSGESGLVCIVLTAPGYWPKLYVESMFSSAYNDDYASGWTWVDEDATGSPVVEAVYKSDFGNQFVMDSSGNVGIGIASPATKLDVRASAPTIRLQETSSGGDKRLEFSISNTAIGRISAPQSASQLAFETVGSERMRIAANGNIGVGTTAPAHTLVVAGAVYASADASSVSYYMPASAAIRSAGNMYIDADTSGSGGFTRAGTGDIILRTAAASERMRIVSNGNIGIGTSTPVGELEISNSGEPDIFLSRTGLANNHGASGVGQIYFRDSNNAYNTASIQSVGYMPGTSGILQFKTTKTGTLTTRMTISEDGNVGIANTAPANKLFVTGDIGLDGISVRDTATTTTTATTQITLFEYPVATYDSCEVLIKAVSGGQRHVSKLLVTANSTVAIATEYGILQTGSTLYTVDTDVASSNTRIRITPASTTSTVFKASYELITA